MNGEGEFGYDYWNPGVSSGSSSSGGSWWESVLGYAIKGAVDYRTRLPQLSGSGQLIMGADGNLYQAGQVAGRVVNSANNQQIPQWAILAGLALGGVLLYKLVK